MEQMNSGVTSTSHEDEDIERASVKLNLVVAIDFGTTYSGYAFSIGTSRAGEISMMKQPTGGGGERKIRTCLLLEPSHRFHSFGTAAQEHYYDQLTEEEQSSWLYFDRFKMILHSSKTLDREKELEAANGQKVLALTVFSRSLEFFKDSALTDINRSAAMDFQVNEVTWVVTVPAIWEEPAKQFMREAAYEAGMASPAQPNQLVIALEPEAASLYCHQMQMADRDAAGGGIMTQMKPGVRYIIIDCGGGTVDCTIHEITDRKHIKALLPPSGGPWGGTQVDKNFEVLLENVFEEENIRQFKESKSADWTQLISCDFEDRKREPLAPGRSLSIRIDPLYTFLKDKGLFPEQMVKYFNNPQITLRRGAIRIGYDEAIKLFKPVVDNIERHVAAMVQRVNGLKYIIVVGGFAESSYLEHRIKAMFGDQLRIIIPTDARLSVVKGAVLFGQNPNSICERHAVHTVGIGITQPFIEYYHNPRHRIHGIAGDDDLCDNVFETFIKADEAVAIGSVVQKSFTPSFEGQTQALIDIFFSSKKEVQYTDEEGVWQKGYLLVPLNGYGLNQEVVVKISFAETEFKVTATDSTGNNKQVKLDFLGKYH